MSSVTASRNLRALHGRGMNSSSDAYKLPADAAEMDRLTMQHRIWTIIQGGLYPPEAEDLVQELLRPRQDGTQPQVVDIGSGSGIWAIEMARKFPHVKVLGIDLAECSPLGAPQNCSFIVRDVMNGLDEFENSFSLVHCRAVGGHVPDIAKLVDVIGQILKPGGVFFFFDGNRGMYNTNREVFTPMPLNNWSPSTSTSLAPFPSSLSNARAYSWFSRWMHEALIRMASHGQDRLGGDFVEWHLRNCKRFDNSTVRAKTCWSPVGWEGEERDGEWGGKGAEVGRLMSWNIATFVDATVPLFLSTGVPNETIDYWYTNTRKELFDPSMQMYMKWGIAWAQKLRVDLSARERPGVILKQKHFAKL